MRSLKAWLHPIKRKNFVPTKYSKLCSDHFQESDYLVRPGTYIRRLKPNAVHSNFNFPQYYQPKTVKPRIRNRKRMIDKLNQQVLLMSLIIVKVIPMYRLKRMK